MSVEIQMMEHSNYCAAENGIRICNVSSTLPNCSAENILNAERKVRIELIIVIMDVIGWITIIDYS